jgi:hypothetical protein
MKKVVLVLSVISMVVLSSCSRYITTEQAANGKARCGKWLK